MAKTLLILAAILLVLASLGGCTASPPEAEFTATPTTGYAPVEVQFTDLSQGNIDTWEWDFNNDGVIDSSLQNPVHTYSNPGKYTISLTVCGPSGCDTEVKADYAEFIAESTVVHGITPIQFTDQSTGDIISWAWDFDSDGIIDSTEQNPTYTFREDGLYSVTLTIVTPDCEYTLTKTDYIRVTGCHT